MRVALVSPYSWTYPGGVTRHIEALAAELAATGHDVRVLAPFDPDVRRTALMHRGARPQARPMPGLARPARAHDRLAVQRRRLQPRAHALRRRDAAPGAEGRARFDVVHVHEPVAPVVGWDTLTAADAPLVGTFHCYSEKRAGARRGQRCSARSASSTTCRRGSRSPTRRPGRAGASTAAATAVIPNGVALPEGGADGIPSPRLRAPGEPLRIAFVGQAVERKGLPVLLRAFEAMRRQVPAELTIVGVDPDELAPMLLDPRGDPGASGASATPRSAPRSRPRTCCARRRWAGSRSGWCSRRRSPPARRSSRPTSRATAAW